MARACVPLSLMLFGSWLVDAPPCFRRLRIKYAMTPWGKSSHKPSAIGHRPAIGHQPWAIVFFMWSQPCALMGMTWLSGVIISATPLSSVM